MVHPLIRQRRVEHPPVLELENSRLFLDGEAVDLDGRLRFRPRSLISGTRRGRRCGGTRHED